MGTYNILTTAYLTNSQKKPSGLVSTVVKLPNTLIYLLQTEHTLKSWPFLLVVKKAEASDSRKLTPRVAGELRPSHSAQFSRFHN